MAGFAAFRGTLYDPERVRADDVVAPPYDVVGPPERASLAARSPYNAIHVELPVALEGDPEDPYRHAAAVFASWHDEGIVTVAARPALYVYRMSFNEEDGTGRATTGVIGALALDMDGSGDVLPHEETIAKDKHDRLSLLEAAHANFSPIWGLSLAAGFSKAVEAAMAVADAGPWTAVDNAGVVHEIWSVSDPAAISGVAAAAGSSPVLVADGHHRYETACAFFAAAPEQEGAGAVMAFVVELAEHEISVQAIHRLVRGADPDTLPAELGKWFVTEAAPSDPIELRDMIAAEGCLALVTRGGAWLMRPTAELCQAADDDLDTSRLAVALTDLGYIDVAYQAGVREAKRAVDDGMAEAAVLVRPVSVEQIARSAHGGRRMRPKSTYFYPKPRTGMVFRELQPAPPG